MTTYVDSEFSDLILKISVALDGDGEGDDGHGDGCDGG